MVEPKVRNVSIVAGVSGHKRQVVFQGRGGGQDVERAFVDLPLLAAEVEADRGGAVGDGAADDEDPGAVEKGAQVPASTGAS